MASIVDIYNKNKPADAPFLHRVSEVADALLNNPAKGNAHDVAKVIDEATAEAAEADDGE